MVQGCIWADCLQGAEAHDRHLALPTIPAAIRKDAEGTNVIGRAAGRVKASILGRNGGYQLGCLMVVAPTAAHLPTTPRLASRVHSSSTAAFDWAQSSTRTVGLMTAAGLPAAT